MEHTTHINRKQLSLIPTIVVSFLVIALLGWFFHTIESSAQRSFSIGEVVQPAIHRIFGIETVHAAEGDEYVTVRDASYKARYAGQSVPDPIIMKPGEIKTIDIYFDVLGGSDWSDVYGFTVDDRYHESEFYGRDWRTKYQTAPIGGNTSVGGRAVLNLELSSVGVAPGEYIEKFYLAKEGYSWIQGGYFYLKIQVVGEQEPENGNQEPEVVKPDPPAPPAPVENSAFHAKRTGQSLKSIAVPGGERVKLVVMYQNTGETNWSRYALVSKSGSQFADDSWESGTTIVSRNTSVESGSGIREVLYFQAPPRKGNYELALELQVNGEPMMQGVTVDVEVTKNAPVDQPPPVVSPPAPNNNEPQVIRNNIRLSEEPRIRVGLSQTSGDIVEPIQFVSNEDEYRLFTGTKEQGILRKGEVAIIDVSGTTYSFKGGDFDFKTEHYIRLEPVSDEHAVFTIYNFDRRHKWVGSGTFNEYRGAFEFRLGEVDRKPWIVNDLLFEDYVKGITESADGAAQEFVKANLVAARTYAYMSRGKYPFFDVVGSTYDQLYLGYGAEKRRPNTTKAAEDTRGQMVTYDGQVVQVYYFGNSDGHTRSNADVWGGTPRPWLQPVEATYDLRDGSKMFGHGVGMSQRDARIRAEEQGINHVAILQYYYTGIQVELIYQ